MSEYARQRSPSSSVSSASVVAPSVAAPARQPRGNEAMQEAMRAARLAPPPGTIVEANVDQARVMTHLGAVWSAHRFLVGNNRILQPSNRVEDGSQVVPCESMEEGPPTEIQDDLTNILGSFVGTTRTFWTRWHGGLLSSSARVRVDVLGRDLAPLGSVTGTGSGNTAGSVAGSTALSNGLNAGFAQNGASLGVSSSRADTVGTTLTAGGGVAAPWDVNRYQGTLVVRLTVELEGGTPSRPAEIECGTITGHTTQGLP